MKTGSVVVVLGVALVCSLFLVGQSMPASDPQDGYIHDVGRARRDVAADDDDGTAVENTALPESTGEVTAEGTVQTEVAQTVAVTEETITQTPPDPDNSLVVFKDTTKEQFENNLNETFRTSIAKHVNEFCASSSECGFDETSAAPTDSPTEPATTEQPHTTLSPDDTQTTLPPDDTQTPGLPDGTQTTGAPVETTDAPEDTETTPLSPEDTETTLSPDDTQPTDSPDETTDAPDATETTLSPDDTLITDSPDETTDAPEDTETTLSPEDTETTLSPDDTQPTDSPDETTDAPDATETTLSPADTETTLSPEDTETTLSPEDTETTLSPEDTETTLSPEDTETTPSPEDTETTLSPVDPSIDPDAGDESEAMSDQQDDTQSGETEAGMGSDVLRRRLLAAETYEYVTSDDVIIVELRSTGESGKDLGVEYYVQLPATDGGADGTKLERGTLDTVVTENVGTIMEDLGGIELDVIEAPHATEEPTGEPVVQEEDGGGMEPWLIAVIVLACVLAIVILGGIVVKCNNNKKKSVALGASSSHRVEYHSVARSQPNDYGQSKTEHTYDNPSFDKNERDYQAAASESPKASSGTHL